MKKQVALIRFDLHSGFVGETIVFVRRVRFFKSIKKAKAYNRGLWRRMGSHYLDCDMRPDYPFQKIVGKGQTDFEMYAIHRNIQESNREQIESLIC